jgi:molybdopterin biosynthesis enzyme MoaB
MLSRAVAGLRGGALIVNLPGSPKAVEENLSYIIASLGHGLEIMKGMTGECAGDESRR